MSNASDNNLIGTPSASHHKKSRSILGGVVGALTPSILSSSSANNSEIVIKTGQSAPVTVIHPPCLRGILHKWTNYASGYKSRYFVLENGILSYFRNESEFPQHCKGSLRADIIDVKPDHADKSRFDIIGKGIKYQLKAHNHTEAKNWIWALVESRQYVLDKARTSQTSGEMTDRAAAGESENESTASIDGTSRALSQLRMSANGDSISNEVKACFDILKANIANLAVDLSDKKSLQESLSKLEDLYEKREIKWHKQFERRRQWEALVKSIVDVGIEGSNNTQQPGPEKDASKEEFNSDFEDSSQGEAHDARDDDSDSENDEEFFDAENEATPAIEQLLGFDSYNDEDDQVSDSKTLTGRETGVKMNIEFSDSASTEATDGMILLSSTTADGQTFTRKKRLRSIVGPTQLANLLPVSKCPKLRSSLPLPPNAQKPSLSVWGFLKSAIGKDLSKITLPVFFNEPLTMLQRFAEEMEYSPALSLAGRLGSPAFHLSKDDPAGRVAAQMGWSEAICASLTPEQVSHARMLLVTAFAMSNYAGTVGRNNKPFNPMLGETFEFVSRDNQFRYLSEQVCHHPPISAAFAESPDFVFWGEVNVKSKFWGKTLEIHPLGNNHVRLPVFDANGIITGTEHFSWKKVTTSVNGLITGRLWITNTGDMVVTNHRTGEEAVLTFKKKDSGGWFGSSGGSTDDSSLDRELVGKMFSATKTPLYALAGSWDSELHCTAIDPKSGSLCSLLSPNGNLVLWRRNELPAHSKDQFQFTTFAMQLNDLPAYLDKVLPPTDSRRRGDCRAMEEGRWDDADAAKLNLETIQRNRRKMLQGKYDNFGTPSAPPPEFLGGIAGNDTGRAAAVMQTLSRSRDPSRSAHVATTLQSLDVGENWWRPRWFVREKDSDTGDEHWRFTREYWSFRGEGLPGETLPEWPQWVVPIFAEVNSNGL